MPAYCSRVRIAIGLSTKTGNLVACLLAVPSISSPRHVVFARIQYTPVFEEPMAQHKGGSMTEKERGKPEGTPGHGPPDTPGKPDRPPGPPDRPPGPPNPPKPPKPREVG